MRKQPIKIDDDVKQDMIEAIKVYFLEERDVDLGDLAAVMVFDFFIEKLGKEVYNQGVRDTIQYMNDRLDDAYSLEK